MKSKLNRKKKGLLLAPDDLWVGMYISVHSLKGSNKPMPYFGRAGEITAINLPFVIVRVVGGTEVATLDVRYMNLMPVTEEFVLAQAVFQDKQGV